MSRAAFLAYEPMVLETVVETILSGASWLPPLSQIMPSVDGWGGGGAGRLLIGGGGGPEHAALLNTFVVVEGVPVAYVLGAAGAPPGGNGGATTWDGGTLTANGGTGALLAGGAGGTGGIGDVTHNGGAGSTGAAAENGGGGGGSNTAGSGTTPGVPDGGANVANTAGTNLAGGGSSAVNSHAGSPGLIRLSYLRRALPGYPWISGMAFGRDTANATTRPLTIPGPDSGVLLYYAAGDGPIAGQNIAGATPIVQMQDASVTTCLGVYVADSSATPPATLTSGNEQYAWCVVRIEGTGGAASFTGAAATATSTNANPPLVTQAAVKPTIYFTVIEWDASGAAITSLSAGYTPMLIIPLEATQGGVQLAIAVLYETSGSNNPGATVTGLQEWVAATIAAPAP